MTNPRQKPELGEIKCPNCGEYFPITEALRHQLAEQAREELKGEAIEQQKALASREKVIKEREAELVSAEKGIDQKVEERLKQATANIEKSALEKARAGLEVELKSLKGEVAEKAEAIKKAQELEITLRKERRELLFKEIGYG